jgi:hypothetical protein
VLLRRVLLRRVLLRRVAAVRAVVDAAPELVERALALARKPPPLGALGPRAVVARVAAEVARQRPGPAPRSGARKRPPATVDGAARVEVAARADGRRRRRR